jgi:glyoxylase-like metal-dependent hydrolase (beta-lactamase superfamily II)
VFAGAGEAYRDLRIVVPDEIVEEERTIDLGGVTVRLVPEPVAHTAGDLWAVVKPDGIVLAGDLWCNDFERYVSDGSVAGEAAAIDHLRDAGGVCLPGLGPPAPIEAGDPLQPTWPGSSNGRPRRWTAGWWERSCAGTSARRSTLRPANPAA